MIALEHFNPPKRDLKPISNCPTIPQIPNPPATTGHFLSLWIHLDTVCYFKKRNKEQSSGGLVEI